MLVPMSSISFPFCSSKAHPPVISKHRSEFIDLRLKQFIHQNQIQEWPLDCVAICARSSREAMAFKG